MSARAEKLKRRAARIEAGLSPKALDGQRDFEAACARLKMRGVLRSQEPIVSLAPKRRAYAWVGLGLFALAILSVLFAAALGAR